MSEDAATLSRGRGIELALAIEDDGWDDALWGDLRRLVERAVAAAAERAVLLGAIETELSVVLTGDAAVHELNRQWRDKDRPTNVLSFPAFDIRPGEMPGPLVGDIVVARETVLAEAAAEGKLPREHFAHLIVHGFLHCLGYDHLEETDAETMERLEVTILADLGIADPYGVSEEASPSMEASR
ncbi:rRNA maturation RNase YbeY [Consotaella aegiceratis]|uniref:rRNA maturation RNase YbeY n=1 Tax=Consotaella aegiceratis TaxID=3097961 RepID=UPI002F3E7B75